MFSLANKLTRKSAIFLFVLDSGRSLSIEAVLLFYFDSSYRTKETHRTVCD